MRDPTEADIVFCRMKTETAKNLLPCPFCGSKAVLYTSLLPVDSSLFRASCTGCLSESGIYESIEQVEQVWNRRVMWTNATDIIPEFASRWMRGHKCRRKARWKKKFARLMGV